ncbi:MAG: alpha/beta hydrolase [Pleurocapsa minor GSE-CHR-MK-17-07R]|jgi:predicted esterase|nr:alpha/beta hydrolase [Pleurocapsa minor GSE-CHR-MK 17-07R]
MADRIHEGGQILVSGVPLEQAQAAVIMVHGRGASARDILSLSQYFPVPGVSFLAPQAAGHAWYPYSFLQPLASNEPFLSSALNTLSELLAHVEAQGIARDKIVLLGFSQGACLASEFAARNASRFGGVVAFSGGLIGPDGTPRDYAGSLAGTPAFFGCSDVDFHIPKERVIESAEVYQKLGADTTMRLYPGMDHTVNDEELAWAQTLLQSLVAPA